MRIRIDKNYDYPDIARQTPNFSGKWQDIQLIESSEDHCDLYVVFNHPNRYDYKVTCRKGGRILIIQEPPYKQGNFYLKNEQDFDLIITHFDDVNVQTLRQPAMLPWFVDKDYDFLRDINFDQLEKKNKAVWITSNKNQNPGHQSRLKLLDLLLNEEASGIEIYGKGLNPVDDKYQVLASSKYCIAIENYSATDYWTEKIMDAYLSLSMPIYSGCLNLERYFPDGSFVQIDISQPEKAVDHIKQVLNSDLFEENKEKILEARDRILNEFQFFPWIDSLIKNETIVLGDYQEFEFYKTRKVHLIKRLGKKLFSRS